MLSYVDNVKLNFILEHNLSIHNICGGSGQSRNPVSSTIKSTWAAATVACLLQLSLPCGNVVRFLSRLLLLYV